MSPLIALSLLLNQATPQNHDGYVVRVGGKGTITLVRGAQRIPLTARVLGDDVFLTKGDRFEHTGSAYVYYFSGSNIYRVPTLTGVAPAVGESSGHKAAKAMIAGRRQGKPAAAIAKVLARDAGATPFWVPESGTAAFVVVVADAADRPTEIELASGQKFPVSPKELTVRGPVCLLKSPALTESLRELKAGAEFPIIFRLTKGSMVSAHFTKFDGQSRFIEDRAQTLSALDVDDIGWFDAYNELASELETSGCNIQATTMAVEWWLSEPENRAAEGALLNAAAKFDLGAVDAYLLKGRKTLR